MVIVLQCSFTSLRIKQIRARGWKALSVKSSQSYKKTYQRRDLQHIILVLFKPFKDILSTRLEMVRSSEQTVLDQSQCNADIREGIGKQHRRTEIIDRILY